MGSSDAYDVSVLLSSLLPWKCGRPAQSKCLDPIREDLIADCIKKFYLTPERPSLGALFQEVKRRFAEQQLPSPNYRTVRRQVETLDARVEIRKREGPKAAREKLGPVDVSTLRPGSPLDILQIDHTLVDASLLINSSASQSAARGCRSISILQPAP
jgi:putative transposase